jgi:hypothetical protein
MYASSSGYFTGQVVLNETSNSIEFYIKHKEVASSWNGGLAIQGIQGVNGTQGTIAPGRNATQWTATNDALLFSPTCTVCIPLTSIQAYGLNDKIVVYPNPTNSIVTVIGVEGNAIITVYNVIGETVLTQQITKEKTEIDLSKETNGIYFIKITNENWLLTKKIIKE